MDLWLFHMDGISTTLKRVLVRWRNALRSFRNPILRRIRPDLLMGAAGLAVLRARYAGDPASVASVMKLARLTPGRDTLAKLEKNIQTGRALHNRFLADRLSDLSFGYWSTGPDVLNLLERFIKSCRPSTLLEFGSGLSTVCLARYMAEIHGNADRTLVYSVEQDSEYLAQTEGLLAELSLGTKVQLIPAPLIMQKVSGLEARCYGIGRGHLVMLRSAQPDLVFIDGPAGEAGVRLCTLPMALGWLSPKAKFFLDDAFRAEELHAARMWSQLAGVKVNGIYLTDKGLLAGEITKDPG